VKEPIWLRRLVIEAIHLDQIRTHGGMAGLRDDGLLESALARPQHKWTYKRKPDIAGLAAAYAYGIVQNHPFRDGNKRVGFLAMVVFLGLNGYDFDATDEDVIAVIMATAAGEVSEGQLAKWIREHTKPAS